MYAEVYYNFLNEDINNKDQVIYFDTLEDNADFTSDASVTVDKINLSFSIKGFINSGSITANQLSLSSGSYFNNKTNAKIKNLDITQGYDDYPSEDFNIIQEGRLDLDKISIDYNNLNIPWIENKGDNAFINFGLSSLPYVLNKKNAKIFFKTHSPYLKKYVSSNSSIIVPFSNEKNAVLFTADNLYLDNKSKIACYVSEAIKDGTYPNIQVLSYNICTIDDNANIEPKIIQNMLCGFKDKATNKYLVFDNVRSVNNHKILADVKVLSFTQEVVGLYSKEKVEELTIQKNLDILKLGKPYPNINKIMHGNSIIIEDNEIINILPDNISAALEFKVKNTTRLDSINIKGKIDISNCKINKIIPAVLFKRVNVFEIENGLIIYEQGCIISKNTPALTIDGYMNSDIYNKGIIKAENSTAIVMFENDNNKKIVNSGEISGNYVLDSRIEMPIGDNITFNNTSSAVATGKFKITNHDFTLENSGVIINSAFECDNNFEINIINNNQITLKNIKITGESKPILSLKNYNTGNFKLNNTINYEKLDIYNSGTLELIQNSVVRNYNSEAGNLIIELSDEVLDNTQPILQVIEKATINDKNASKSKITLKYSSDKKLGSFDNIIIIAATEIAGSGLTRLPNNEIHNDFLYGYNISADKNDVFLLVYNLKLTNNKNLHGDIGWISKDKRFKDIKNPYKMEDVLKISDNIEGINIIEADRRHIYFVNLNLITIGKTYSNSKKNTIYALNTKEDQKLFIVEFSTNTEKISLSIAGTIDGCHDIKNQKVNSATAIALKSLSIAMPLSIENIDINENSSVIGNNAPAILVDMAKNSKLTTIINNKGSIKSIKTNKIKKYKNSAIFFDGLKYIDGKVKNYGTISGQYSIYFNNQDTTGNFLVTNYHSGIIVGDMQIASSNFQLINKGGIKKCKISVLDVNKVAITNEGDMYLTDLLTNNNYNIDIKNSKYIFIENNINCSKLKITNSGIVDIKCHSFIKNYISDDATLKIRLPYYWLQIKNQPLLTTDSFSLSIKGNEKIILYPDKQAVASNFAHPEVILKTKKLLFSSSGEDITRDQNFINLLFSEKLLKLSSILIEILDPHIIDDMGDDYKYIVARIRYKSIDELKKLIQGQYLQAKTNVFSSDIEEKIKISIAATDKSYYTRGAAIIIGKKNEADLLLRNIYGGHGSTSIPAVKLNILEKTTLESILISANLYSDQHYQQSLYLSGSELELEQGIIIDKGVEIKTYSSSAIYINTKIKSNIYNYGIIVAEQSNAIEINGLANMLDGTITNYNKIKGDYVFYLPVDENYETDVSSRSANCVINNAKTGVMEGKFKISGKNFSIVNSGTIVESAVELDYKAHLKINNSGYIDFKEIIFNNSNSVNITNTKSGILSCATTDLVIDDNNNYIINYGILKSGGSIVLNTNYTSYGTLTAKSLLSTLENEVTFKIAKNSVAQFSNVGGYNNNIKIVGPGKLQIVHSSLNGNIIMHKDDNYNQDGVLELVNDVKQQTGRFIAGKLISNNNYSFNIAVAAKAIFTQAMQQQVKIINNGNLELQQGTSLSSYIGCGKLVLVVNDNIQTSEYLMNCMNDVNFSKNSQVVLKPNVKNVSFLNKKINIITANKIKYDNKDITNEHIEELISSVNSGSVLLSLTNCAVENKGKKITASLSLKNIDKLVALTNKTLLDNQLQLQKINNLSNNTKSSNYSPQISKLIDHILLQVSTAKLPQESIDIIKYLLIDDNIKFKKEIANIRQKLLANNINQKTNALIKQLLPKNSAIVNNALLLLPNQINKNIANTNSIKAKLNNISGVTNKALIKSADVNIWLEISNYRNICKLNEKYFDHSYNSNVISLAIDDTHNLKCKSGLQLSVIKTSINKLQLANDYNSINSIMLASYTQFKQKNYKLQLSASYSNNLHQEQIKNNIFKVNKTFNYNSHSFNINAYLAWFHQYNNLALEASVNLAISNLFTPDFGFPLELHCKKTSQIINLELSSYLNYTYQITANKNIKFGLLLSCKNYLQNNNFTQASILNKKFNIYWQKYYLSKINFSALAKIDISHKFIIDINLEYFEKKYLISKANIHYYF